MLLALNFASLPRIGEDAIDGHTEKSQVSRDCV